MCLPAIKGAKGQSESATSLTSHPTLSSYAALSRPLVLFLRSEIRQHFFARKRVRARPRWLIERGLCGLVKVPLSLSLSLSPRFSIRGNNIHFSLVPIVNLGALAAFIYSCTSLRVPLIRDSFQTYKLPVSTFFSLSFLCGRAEKFAFAAFWPRVMARV